MAQLAKSTAKMKIQIGKADVVKNPVLMKKSTCIAGIVFMVLSLAEVISLTFHISGVNPIIKPLLIPSLAIAALCALLPEHRGWKTTLLAVTLALHTAGDVLLMLDGNAFVFFVAGLGAFLLGHICYLVILLSGVGPIHKRAVMLLCLLPLVIALVAASFFKVEGVMRAVLFFYALVLLYVPICGVFWLLRGRKMGWLILTGGLLFVASDTMIALNVFNGISFPLRHAIVMLTYLAAEWLIVSGIVRQQLHNQPSA